MKTGKQSIKAVCGSKASIAGFFRSIKVQLLNGLS
jgi:hypothetical protein